MNNQQEETWWKKPRNVTVLVDNQSWIQPWAERLVKTLNEKEDMAVLARTWDDIRSGGVCFFLGCMKVVPKGILDKNRRNLVVHESALPEGRGFAPLTWQILEGKDEVSICLIEASESPDMGPIVYMDTLRFEGHELCPEVRSIQGEATIDLCNRYLSANTPPIGRRQKGKHSIYPRRTPEDSRLNLNKSLIEQFNLLRVVDNERYPGFFDLRGHRYELTIKKVSST